VVLQPSAYLILTPSVGSLCFGGWWSLELSRAGPSQLSDLGVGRHGLAESNYWVQFQREWGTTSTAVGLNRYVFHGTEASAERTAAWNTSEIYGSLHFRGWHLAPRIEGWWDIDRVHGWYFEASAMVPVLGNIEGVPFWAIYLGGSMGYSAGQHNNTARPEQKFYFARPGLSHVELTASTDLRLPFAGNLLVEGHFQFNRDPRTKVVNAEGDTRRNKAWIDLIMSLPVLSIYQR
jgi:hypothetical protein